MPQFLCQKSFVINKQSLKMNYIDFFIGFFLMNAMPHFVLGVWNGRILSLFGYGKKANIFYGLFCFLISLSLYLWKYGPDRFFNNGIFIGALTVLLIYFVTGNFVKNFFAEKNN